MTALNNDIQTSKPTSTEGGFAILWTPFVLIPKQMADEENSDLWLNFLRRRIPRDQQQEVVECKAYSCICLYETRHAGQQHIIPTLLNKSTEKQLDTVVCAIRQNDKLAVVCIKEGKLQLANIYEAATKEQLLFWILNIYTQLQLPDTTPLYIQCGDGTRKLLYSHLNTQEL